jgi:hypothetical protein
MFLSAGMTEAQMEEAPEQQTLARPLEAREFAENALRYLDEARKQLATKDLAQGLLLQASDSSQDAIAAIDDVMKLIGSHKMDHVYEVRELESRDSRARSPALWTSGANSMSANSKIEWTEATWNPVRGCVEISPGCKHC